MIEMNQEFRKILTCYHCGNKADMKRVTLFEDQDADWDYNDVAVEYFYNYSLYKCPVCNSVTLELYQYNSDETNPDGTPIEKFDVLYPPIDVNNQNIPDAVRNAYEAALKVRYVEGAICALSLRRTLEKMCKDKDAKGKTLYERLNYLSDNGVIPPLLDDITLILKDLGNEAAHGDEVEFDEDLISEMVRFTKIILEYVYVLPKELDKIQLDLQLRKQGNLNK